MKLLIIIAIGGDLLDATTENCGAARSNLCRIIGFAGSYPVPIQDLKPDVLMMQPPRIWNRCDTADVLRPAKIRSVSIQ